MYWLGSFLLFIFNAMPRNCRGRLCWCQAVQRPFIALGRASYSLYLWHFPLLDYCEYVELGKLSARMMAVVCLLSLLDSFLSFQFVECPFRFPSRNGA